MQNLTGIFFIPIAMMLVSHEKQKADLLLYNGVIYTVNDDFTVTDALLLSQGKVIDMGDAVRLRNQYRIAQEQDLQGKPVYPGFIDPHCHFYGYGLTLRQADLTGTTSEEEIVLRLKQHHEQFPGTWIMGRGWDQNDWKQKDFPDKDILDAAFPDIPVYLTRVDGHAAWVNSKALMLAGIQENTSVNGGEIITDTRGIRGILIDNAMVLVEKHLPLNRYRDQVQALQAAEKNCFGAGLTMVADAGLDREIVELVDSLQQAKQLRIRIYAMLNPTTDNFNRYIKSGISRTDRLFVRSIKLFADGALGSRGALLLHPYSDDPGNLGLQVSTTAYLTGICEQALEKGYQVNTHCIGDSAVRLMLGIYASMLPVQNDLRWRIEHAQVVHPDDFPYFGRYGIIPSVQTTHATSDMYWAGERLGPERIKTAYAYKTLLAQNGWMPNGSDFPVESINPLYGFYAAVARKDLKGYPPEGYQKQEALSREDALRAMTCWSAKACFEENHTGSLEPGKVADLVILDRDIMRIAEAEIQHARVLETYVDGIRVFTAKREE
jgi:hypothetical protein